MIDIEFNDRRYSIPIDVYNNLFLFYKLNRETILNSKYNFIMSHFEFRLSDLNGLDISNKIPTLISKDHCINANGCQSLNISQFKTLCKDLKIDDKGLIKSLLLVSAEEDNILALSYLDKIEEYSLQFIITDKNKTDYLSSKESFSSIGNPNNVILLEDILPDDKLKELTVDGDIKNIDLYKLLDFINIKMKDINEINHLLSIRNNTYVIVQTKQNVLFLESIYNINIFNFKHLYTKITRNIYGKNYIFVLQYPMKNFTVSHFINTKKMKIFNFSENTMKRIKSEIKLLSLDYSEKNLNSKLKSIDINTDSGDPFEIIKYLRILYHNLKNNILN